MAKRQQTVREGAFTHAFFSSFLGQSVADPSLMLACGDPLRQLPRTKHP
jgi:hypothetical protein